MNTVKQIVLILIITVVSITTAFAQDGTEMDLNGTSWILRAFALDDVWVEVLPNTEVTIEFADGQFFASAGCNTLFGEYVLDGDTLNIQYVGTSLMACEDDIMEQESRLAEALEAATRISQDDNTLTIHYGENVSLVLDSHQMIDEGGLFALEDTVWELMAVRALDALTAADTDRPAIVTFNTDGTFHVNTGCGELAGSYSVDGDTISFEVQMTTAMADCSEIQVGQGLAIENLIQNATNFSIEGGTLTLAIDDDNDANFSRVEMMDAGGLEPEITIDDGGLFATDTVVSGTVVVRDESGITVLPAGTQITIQLVDISLADAEAVVLSRITLSNFNSLPVTFNLGVNASDIDETNTYAIEASVTDSDGNLLYTNDTVHPVLTDDTGLTTDVELIRIDSTDMDMTDSVDLEGTVWIFRAFALDDEWVEVLPETEITITFADGSVTGSAGCNTYVGGYTLDENNIVTIGEIATTRIGCEDDIAFQEGTFLEALASAETITLEGESLFIHYSDNVFLVFDIPQVLDGE